MKEVRLLSRNATLLSAALLASVISLTAQAEPEKVHYDHPGLLIQNATLTNGSGDGTATVTVDPYGSFRELSFDPVGVKGASDTTYESGLWFSGAGRANQGGHGLFLSNGSIYGPNLPSMAFQSAGASQASSEFTVDGIRFQLVQEMLPSGNGISTFRQTYTLTNQTGAPTSFDLLRHLDGDLQFDGSISDRGGVSSDKQQVFEFDSGDDPSQPTTFVGIQMSGGTDLGFRVAAYSFKDDVFDLGRSVLFHNLFPDANHDNLTDTEFDVTLTQGRSFTLAAGASAQLVVDTVLGFAPPSQTSGVKLELLASTKSISAAGGQVTYTASVTSGSVPVPGKSVVFTTTGTTGNNGVSTVLTGASGEAQLGFQPWFPGVDTVTAFVDLNLNGRLDPGEPQASAPLTVTLPASTAGTASGTGRVSLGETLGNLTLSLQSQRGRITGAIAFAPLAGSLLDLKSTRLDAVCFGGTPGNLTLVVLGTTRVAGYGVVPFRLDGLDRGRSVNTPDRCVLTLLPTGSGGVAVSYGGDLITTAGVPSDLVFQPAK
jgi:hypothetical protein